MSSRNVHFLPFPASCLLRTISPGLWASGETWQQKGLGAESLPNDIDLAGSCVQTTARGDGGTAASTAPAFMGFRDHLWPSRHDVRGLGPPPSLCSTPWVRLGKSLILGWGPGKLGGVCEVASPLSSPRPISCIDLAGHGPPSGNLIWDMRSRGHVGQRPLRKAGDHPGETEKALQP